MTKTRLMNSPKAIEAAFKTAAQAQPQFALGVSYAIGSAEPVVFTSGPTRKGGSTAVAPDAPWHIGSVSKSFTSTLVMRFVERGLLDLDAPISEYLSAYQAQMHDDWKSCTLRQLLSHTSGLAANPPKALTRKTCMADSEIGRRTVLAAVWGHPKAAQAGQFLYSNLGYMLAGFVCEVAAQSSWEHLILKELAAPLGLQSLGFGAPAQKGAAFGHKSILGFKRPVDPSRPDSDNPQWMGPAGTIHMTLSDLVKWGQFHLQASRGDQTGLLSTQSCHIMQTPMAEAYGLGWVIETTDTQGQSIWHNGSNTMWYTVLRLFPERQIAIAISTNVFAPHRIDAVLNSLASQV